MAVQRARVYECRMKTGVSWEGMASFITALSKPSFSRKQTNIGVLATRAGLGGIVVCK